MGWEPGQATLRKEGGVWKQNPQMLLIPGRDSFITFNDAAKLTRFMKERGWDEDTRPYVDNRKAKYKWKRKPKTKKGGGKDDGRVE